MKVSREKIIELGLEIEDLLNWAETAKANKLRCWYIKNTTKEERDIWIDKSDNDEELEYSLQFL